MFLALTAQPHFWAKGKPILFLGEWCRRQDRPEDWASGLGEVMPSPWVDRTRFNQAAEYVDALGERLLPVLADAFNTVHETKLSARYWRIVAGPWLLHLLHAAYDRHAHLAAADVLSPGFETLLAEDDASPPRDTRDFTLMMMHDEGNLQLMSLLLRERGFPQIPPVKSSSILPTRASDIVGDALIGFGNLVAGRSRPMVNALALSRKDLCKLVFPLRLRQEHFAEINPPPPCESSRTQFRQDLEGRLQECTGAFEKLLPAVLSRFVPLSLLEGYADLRAAANSYRPFPPKIVSATGWYSEELFKVYCAEAAESGTRLLALQHGGGYGQYRFSPLERHETRLSDHFFVWGWASQNPTHLSNLPFPEFVSRRTGRRHGPVLFVPTEHPRYLYRFHSTPVANDWPAYYAAQEEFLAALGDEQRALLVLRSPVNEYGHAPRARISARFPHIRWDSGRRMTQWLEEARLIVVDHLGTTLLEALAANVPTVAYWDPGRWEVRDVAEPLFAVLRRAGILWDTPGGAAGQVSRIASDPEGWWASTAVQDSRKTFIRTFALGAKDWKRHWAEALTR